MSTTDLFYRPNTGLPAGGGLPQSSRSGLPMGKQTALKYSKPKNKAEKAWNEFSTGEHASVDKNDGDENKDGDR